MPKQTQRGLAAPCASAVGPVPEAKARDLPRLPWMDAFIAALSECGTVKQAIGAAGIGQATAYDARRRRPQFAAEWHAAATGRSHAEDCGIATARPAALHPHWRPRFLAALAETSNVSASAAQAGVEPGLVYRTRRTEPDFAAKWQAALFEGYEHLELEVLCHLRSPDPERKLDVTAALRLLAAHRDTVLRLKALAGDDDEETVRDSIDAFLEGMRQRRLANQAILIEAQTVQAPDTEACDVA